MLVTDVGDTDVVKCVDDCFKMLVTIIGHQNLLPFCISVEHQHSNDAISEVSSISKFSHQHPKIVSIFESKTAKITISQNISEVECRV